MYNIYSMHSHYISGDHTRTVCKPTPSAKAGGIMMFAVKKDKCMGCKTLISDKDKVEGSPLCINCFPKESKYYNNSRYNIFGIINCTSHISINQYFT